MTHDGFVIKRRINIYLLLEEFVKLLVVAGLCCQVKFQWWPKWVLNSPITTKAFPVRAIKFWKFSYIFARDASLRVLLLDFLDKKYIKIALIQNDKLFSKMNKIANLRTVLESKIWNNVDLKMPEDKTVKFKEYERIKPFFVNSIKFLGERIWSSWLEICPSSSLTSFRRGKVQLFGKW